MLANFDDLGQSNQSSIDFTYLLPLNCISAEDKDCAFFPTTESVATSEGQRRRDARSVLSNSDKLHTGVMLPGCVRDSHAYVPL